MNDIPLKNSQIPRDYENRASLVPLIDTHELMNLQQSSEYYPNTNKGLPNLTSKRDSVELSSRNPMYQIKSQTIFKSTEGASYKYLKPMKPLPNQNITPSNLLKSQNNLNFNEHESKVEDKYTSDNKDIYPTESIQDQVLSSLTGLPILSNKKPNKKQESESKNESGGFEDIKRILYSTFQNDKQATTKAINQKNSPVKNNIFEIIKKEQTIAKHYESIYKLDRVIEFPILTENQNDLKKSKEKELHQHHIPQSVKTLIKRLNINQVSKSKSQPRSPSFEINMLDDREQIQQFQMLQPFTKALRPPQKKEEIVIPSSKNIRAKKQNRESAQFISISKSKSEIFFLLENIVPENSLASLDKTVDKSQTKPEKNEPKVEKPEVKAVDKLELLGKNYTRTGSPGKDKRNNRYNLYQERKRAMSPDKGNTLPDADVKEGGPVTIRISSAKNLKNGSGKLIDGIKSPEKGSQPSTTTNASKKTVSVKNFVRPELELDNPNRRLYIYRNYTWAINFTNSLCIKPPSEKNFANYRYYICKGNNSILIRTLLKQRWWWSPADSLESADVNFVWSQTKLPKFLNQQKLKKKQNQEQDSIGYSDRASAESTTDGSESDNDTEKKNNLLGKNIQKSISSPVFQKKDISKGKVKHNSIYEQFLTETELSQAVKALRSVNNHNEFDNLTKNAKQPFYQMITDPNQMKISNHLENNYHLGNKKALLYNMKCFYNFIGDSVFNYLPLTFHIKNGVDDKEFQNFVEYFHKRELEIKELESTEEGRKRKNKIANVWIVKPGENTNRGNGINVCNELKQIKDIISVQQQTNLGQPRTYLIQQYLDKPLLYNKRKFDIRCYMLLTSINGIIKGYWYQEGYVRTSSKEFTLKNVTNKLIHLTNDAVQKKGEEYGKFETSNKVSFADFSKYIENISEGKVSFEEKIYPQFKKLATDTIKGTYAVLDPLKREHGFEIFGLDFMVDTNYKVWLIEVNTNPDINTCCSQLTRVIPHMVENAFKIVLDPLFPAPSWPPHKKNVFVPDVENNKFELVFDEIEDGAAFKNFPNANNQMMGLIYEDEEEEEKESDDEN